MKRRDFLKSTATLIGGAAVGGALHPGALMADAAPTKGGTLIWGHSETTQNLDIHQTGTASTIRVLQNVHCAIVTVDKNFNVIPSLAKSFEQSPDGLTYTFHLQPGVKFHNGKTMTAADVKYSFERCKNPKTGAVNFEVFNDVVAIDTPDEMTVVIKMSRVNAPFLSRLAENGAGAVIPTGSGDDQGKTPIGAGPFKFIRREFGHEVELQRFDDYWEGPAYLDRIIAREVTEPTVRLTGLRTGEMHMINDIPADRIAEIKADPKFQVLTWFPLNWDFVNLNHEFEPFKDPRVRLAFDLTIDKEELLKGALWGQGKTTASPSFPTSSSYNRALKNRAQDLDKAKALLAEAGYGPGKLKVVFKATTNYPYHVESAQIMLEWFRAVGVDMSIVQLDLGRLVEPGLGEQGLPNVDDEFLHAVGTGFPLLQSVEFDRGFQLSEDQGSSHRRTHSKGARHCRSHRARQYLQRSARTYLRSSPRRDLVVPQWLHRSAARRRRARHDRPSEREQLQLPQGVAARLTRRWSAPLARRPTPSSTGHGRARNDIHPE